MQKVPDNEVEMLMEDLTAWLKSTLSPHVFEEFSVAWKPGGIQPEKHSDHSRYIELFCTRFFKETVAMIQHAHKNYLPQIRFSGWYTDYQELIHHLQFCRQKCETFCGQQEVLDVVKDYILKDKTQKPFVIHAPSGGGKTSLMAMIMNSLTSWLSKTKHIAVIRFLGTTPLTMNIYDVLFSVMGQLADDANIIMEPVGYKTMKNLLEYLPRFFRRVASSLKKPVVILLDSIDQLGPAHDAYAMKWLPLLLPSNMKLIISTLPKEHNILDTIQDLMPDQEQYVSVPSLSASTGKEIIQTYLKMKGRTVTEQQSNLIMKKFSKAPGPLFLKLVLDEAMKWNSYTPEHQLELADTVQSAISYLFMNLENKFGVVFTSRALGYITVALNGISETELEDVLSNDDEVLDDVYRYHNPPVEGIVKIPPVLWARLNYDLKEYFVKRRSFNKYTLNWYHRQFTETARARYASGKSGELLHKNMAEIFMSEEGIKRTVTLSWRNVTVEDADRQVTKQLVNTNNRRLMACLPYHLIHAGDTMDVGVAKERYFCNFKFLKTKVSVFPLNDLIDELSEFIERSEDSELHKLKMFFLGVKADISKPVRLAVCLLSCIAPDDDDTYLKMLLIDARSRLDLEPNALLIPTYPSLAPRRDTDNALGDSVRGCVDIMAVSNDSLLLQMEGNIMFLFLL